MERKDLDIAGLEAQVYGAAKKISDLEKEKAMLLAIIKENGLEDELSSMDITVSDSEYICVAEIRRLKEVTDERGLSQFEVQCLNTLHNILTNIRTGKEETTPKKKKSHNVADLLKIVGSNGQ